MRPEGLISVIGVQTDEGKLISTQQAVDYGWISPAPGRQPAGWGLKREDVVIGTNLFLDSGRQIMAFAFGFRAPIANYTCQYFGVGTGTTVAKVTDVALEYPIVFTGVTYLKQITQVDYPSAFIARAVMQIAASECNGNLISEFGLYSGGSVLMARKVKAGAINKDSSFSPILSWSLRM